MSTAGVASTLRGARRGLGTWADRRIKWLLVAPVVLFILALTIFPLGYSVWLSVVQFDFRLEGHPWVGEKNFYDVITNTVFQDALWRTFAIVAIIIAVEFAVGLVLALLLVQPFRGRRFVIPILIMPLFMAPIAVGQTWRLIWDNQSGPVNYILSLIWPGDVTITWTVESPYNWIAIVVTDAWQWVPFMFIILLAGLVAIPEDVYEAASLDGASKWEIFREVTLPLLAPIITIAIAFRMIDALKLFDIVFALTGGGPGTSTFTTSFFLFEQGFRLFRLDVAAAGSWIFLIIVAAISFQLVRRLLPR
ncbi:MAG: carbohydrate ABC transporter permease [Gaiellales bacterium]